MSLAIKEVASRQLVRLMHAYAHTHAHAHIRGDMPASRDHANTHDAGLGRASRAVCLTRRWVGAQVIDGHCGVDTALLNNRNVDICSVHYYEGRSMVERLGQDIAVGGVRAASV